MAEKLYWQIRTTPVELRAMLRTLGDAYPIVEGQGRGTQLAFSSIDAPGTCEVERQGKQATIRYGSTAAAGRGLGTVLSSLSRSGRSAPESSPFRTFGIMLDCSRSAVVTVEHMKGWLRRLTLLGYNLVMLYTEETYELPGEPFFGYQRGAYTSAELKEIDGYAAKLNIDVVPCIQTLGHLEHILKHTAYTRVRDTARVLMVGEKRTYALIEKMVSRWRQCCRTQRIHIGMDEAHDMGLGQYLRKNGYRDRFDLFNEHLEKVVRICRRHQFKPMIWSDMYFRLGSAHDDYYDPGTRIPKRVSEKIPREVELVYWDYYHDDPKFYSNWIAKHRAMGKEPVMGSGVWTWNKYWHDRRITEANAGACIDACRKSGVDELFFTMWGDNGAYCDHDSAFAGLVWCAERAYSGTKSSANELRRRFATICGGSFDAHQRASDIHGGIGRFEPSLWDDPFFETKLRTHCHDNAQRMARIADGYAQLARALQGHQRDRSTGDLRLAYRIAAVFARRYDISAQLLRAYRKKDRAALRRVRKKIPETVRAVQAAEKSFRDMWLSHNKPNGLEVAQGRFGILEVRLREMGRRIDDYLRGDIDEIAELEWRPVD